AGAVFSFQSSALHLDRFAQTKTVGMIHLFNFRGRRDHCSRGPNPGKISYSVRTRRQVIAKEERSIATQLEIIAKPVARSARRHTNRLVLELRIPRFKNRWQRIIERDEMRRLVHFELERDQHAVPYA